MGSSEGISPSLHSILYFCMIDTIKININDLDSGSPGQALRPVNKKEVHALKNYKYFFNYFKKYKILMLVIS